MGGSLGCLTAVDMARTTSASVPANVRTGGVAPVTSPWPSLRGAMFAFAQQGPALQACLHRPQWRTHGGSAVAPVYASVILESVRALMDSREGRAKGVS